MWFKKKIKTSYYLRILEITTEADVKERANSTVKPLDILDQRAAVDAEVEGHFPRNNPHYR
jgi:hypothetical protein